MNLELPSASGAGRADSDTSDVAASRPLRRRQAVLLDAILRVTVVLGLPAVIAGSWLALDHGQPWRVVAFTATYLVLVVITFRSGVPYAVRAWVLVGLIYGLSLQELAEDGLSGSGRVLLLCAAVMAALLLSRWVAVAGVAVAGLTLAVFGWLFSSGRIAVPAAALATSLDAGEWWAGSVVLVLLAGVLVASHAYLVTALADALDGARGLTTELETLSDELEERVAERTTELETANRELEAFAYSVAHDLRSPLRALNGFAHLIESDPASTLSKDVRRYLDRIRAASVRMGDLIDALLELSKVVRHEMRLHAVDLTELARELAGELADRHSEHPVEVEVEPGLVVRGDPHLLRTLLANLLENSFKFTRGRSTPRIEVGWVETGGGRAIRVRDNGTGFDMQYAAGLFKPFERLHGRADIEGAGIGLATARRVVERHGGRIWAEAEVNLGASFFFTLPRTG